MLFDITENTKLVSVYHPKDRTGAALTTEWISMKNATKATWILDFGTLTSTSNFAVTLAVANDASGTKSATIGASTDLGLTHYYTNSGDTYSKTTVSSSTFNVTKSSDSKIFIIEAKAEDMGQFTSTSVTYSADYVRLSAATPGAHACLTSCVCLLTGLRYQQDSPPSAIT
jgi:hypothetical protein